MTRPSLVPLAHQFQVFLGALERGEPTKAEALVRLVELTGAQIVTNSEEGRALGWVDGKMYCACPGAPGSDAWLDVIARILRRDLELRLRHGLDTLLRMAFQSLPTVQGDNLPSVLSRWTRELRQALGELVVATVVLVRDDDGGLLTAKSDPPELLAARLGDAPEPRANLLTWLDASEAAPVLLPEGTWSTNPGLQGVGYRLGVDGWLIVETRAPKAIEAALRTLALLLGTTLRGVIQEQEARRLSELQTLVAAVDPRAPDVEALVRGLSSAFDAEAASLFLVANQALYLSATTDPALRARSTQGGVSYQQGEGVTGWVWETGCAIRLSNGDDPEEVARVIGRPYAGPSHPEMSELSAVRTAMVVPLRAPGEGGQYRHIGVIRVCRPAEQGNFGVRDERALKNVADLLGTLFADHWERILHRALWSTQRESVIVSSDSDSPVILDANPGAEALLEYTREHLTRLRPAQLYMDKPAAKGALARARLGEEGPFELRARRSDGAAVPVSLRFRFPTDPLVTPHQRYIVGIAHDDTERVGKVQLGERLERVLDEFQICYFRSDLDGKTVHSSRTEQSLTGYSDAELRVLERKKLWAQPSERQKLLNRMKLSPSRSLRGEVIHLRRKDGNELIVEADVLLTRVDGEEFMEGFYRDVTHRIQMQALVNASVDRVLPDAELFRRLVDSQQALIVFIASIGHQLKTPLTNVIESLRNLRDDVGRPELQGFRVERAIGHVERGLELVRDLSLVHHALEGRVPVVQPVDVGVLCSRLGEEFAARFRRARVRLDLDTTVLPTLVAVPTEPNLLRQVLQNLLDNAVKYSRPGSTIRVRANRRPRRVAIWNQGLRIAPADRDRIFERGARTREAMSTRAQGTGLGLWLVRQLATAIEGAVDFEEVVDESGEIWNVFTVSLP